MTYDWKLWAKLDSVIEKTDVDWDGCCESALKVALNLPDTNVEDCDWAITTVEALPTAIQWVVSVKMCGNAYEKAIRCDINTGNQILIITEINTETGIPTSTYWDMISGAAYTGNPATDLVMCPDIDTESDAQIMCDWGAEFLRWIVKKDWEPTGVSFDTDTTGAAFTASGSETFGACEVAIENYVWDVCYEVDTAWVITWGSAYTIKNADWTLSYYDKATNVLVDTSLPTTSIVPCIEEVKDYEEASRTCFENTATDERFTKITYVNPLDAENDNYEVWLDGDWSIITEPTGVTPCEWDCTSKVHYEWCYDNWVGVISVHGIIEYTGLVGTYKTAIVVGSTDPAIAVWADVIASIDSWTKVDCVAPEEIVDRTTTHARTSGNNTYTAPFRSFSITAVSSDVTLNGQAMMQGFTVSLDSQENEEHVTPQVVTWGDYFVTYVI